jgi:hypothetical protein
MQPFGALLVAAGLLMAPASTAAAQQLTSDPGTSARAAARWLAQQVTPQGFIPSAVPPGTAPDLGATSQAVVALAAVGVADGPARQMAAYLAAHVDDYVVADGADQPGALGWLILGAVALGSDPRAFGGTDLVARLRATEQPNGLFGVQDAQFDGAFRQGVALLALDAAGEAEPEGVAWLRDQQCSEGGWVAFRASTDEPCPAVDPATFAGPDTNSTALAIVALAAHGTAPAQDALAWLQSVRLAGGGWGYLGTTSGALDANSTGLVLQALLTSSPTLDSRGAAALLGLQIGCGGDAADRGAFAFQADPGGLVPNALATVQAMPALAGTVLPLAPRTLSAELPAAPACAAPAVVAPPAAPAGTLPRTGSTAADPVPAGAAAIALVAVGAGMVLASRRRAQP